MADKERRRPSSRTLAVLVAVGNLVVCAAVFAAVTCADAPDGAHGGLRPPESSVPATTDESGRHERSCPQAVASGPRYPA